MRAAILCFSAAMDAMIATLDWPRIEAELDAYGAAATGPLLAPEECAALIAMYDEPARFRSRVVMARHGFGSGEYQYFAYPLPPLVAGLRAGFWPHLVGIANRWTGGEYLATHAEYLARCHAAGQVKPTPLLLRYGAGDYKCLHQDLYGAEVFPLQVAILLSAPAVDFGSGAFVLTEQRPRMQSRAEVVPLVQGEAVVFAVAERPAQGTRGTYRVKLRHGVSRVTWGARHTLGVIFHDAA